MTKIKSYSDNNSRLLWKKNNDPWKDASIHGPVDDSQFDPTKEFYSFNTCYINGNNKTLFIATDQLSHGIKIIESTNMDCNLQIIIAPIRQMNPLPDPRPNIIFSSNIKMNSILEVPFPVPSLPVDGIDVFANSGYTSNITLEGELNGIPLKKTIPPSTPQKIGNLKGSLYFVIKFSDPNDIKKKCRVSFSPKDHQPLVVFVDMKGFSDLNLENNNRQPETINITIQPD